MQTLWEPLHSKHKQIIWIRYDKIPKLQNHCVISLPSWVQILKKYIEIIKIKRSETLNHTIQLSDYAVRLVDCWLSWEFCSSDSNSLLLASTQLDSSLTNQSVLTPRSCEDSMAQNMSWERGKTQLNRCPEKVHAKTKSWVDLSYLAMF